VIKSDVRVAAAAQVDPHGRVAVADEVGVVARVAAGHRVALAVREVLEDRRDRIGLGVLREPDARGEPPSVADRDPGVVDPSDTAR
jgi:hypothetical protein